MFLVVAEDDDGMWWDEPSVFITERDAKDFVRTAPKLPEGYDYSLYRCSQIPLSR